jgi:CDP-glucose 4,6-dehydratase
LITASPFFWQGKKVLLTGHTGFKGAWMAFWLSQMGAKVTGIGLPSNSIPNLFTLADIAKMTSSHITDIRDADTVSSIIKKTNPEIVLHLAAQALVRSGYRDPLTTFSTNIMGTVNILNALRGISSVKAVVTVTTDKVYRNLENIYPYRETDTLGGYDPYSASKAASEIIISSYKDSYFVDQGVAVASARAGNVIGGGDWSEDRLIPDAVRAWNANLPLVIRRPNAIRPWQHVLESLNSYLVLAEKLYANSSLGGSYNFGPNTHEAVTVRKVIELTNRIYGCGSVLWGDGTEGPYEAKILSLDISKAREVLGVTPRWGLRETIERTMEWYRQQRNGKSACSLCEADITAFINAKLVQNL